VTLNPHIHLCMLPYEGAFHNHLAYRLLSVSCLWQLHLCSMHDDECLSRPHTCFVALPEGASLYMPCCAVLSHVMLLPCCAVPCCAVPCCAVPRSSGIPLAFPQWRDGPLPFNGFADKMEWTVVGTVSGLVVFVEAASMIMSCGWSCLELSLHMCVCVCVCVCVDSAAHHLVLSFLCAASPVPNRSLRVSL
jgi:hypothetical protein